MLKAQLNRARSPSFGCCQKYICILYWYYIYTFIEYFSFQFDHPYLTIHADADDDDDYAILNRTKRIIITMSDDEQTTKKKRKTSEKSQNLFNRNNILLFSFRFIYSFQLQQKITKNFKKICITANSYTRCIIHIYIFYNIQFTS